MKWGPISVYGGEKQQSKDKRKKKEIYQSSPGELLLGGGVENGA